LSSQSQVQQWQPATASCLDRLSRGFAAVGLAARRVRGVTAERVISGGAEKASLGRTLGAAAVDMETEAVFELAVERAIPHAAVRIILDEVDEELPLLEGLIDATGRLQKGALGALLLRSPRTMGRLRRLERNAWEALRKVASELPRILSA
jgi:hypothetical protein